MATYVGRLFHLGDPLAHIAASHQRQRRTWGTWSRSAAARRGFSQDCHVGARILSIFYLFLTPNPQKYRKIDPKRIQNGSKPIPDHLFRFWSKWTEWIIETNQIEEDGFFQKSFKNVVRKNGFVILRNFVTWTRQTVLPTCWKRPWDHFMVLVRKLVYYCNYQ